MRQSLKKLVEGIEAGFEIFFYILIGIIASPFFVIVWVLGFIYCSYIYCKYTELSYMECVRYYFTDMSPYTDECRNRFGAFYYTKKPFDRGEYDRVKNIVKGLKRL
jgi:hypothetical protein